MSKLGVEGENPYAEPKSPLTGLPEAPASRKTGFTRFQALTIIAIATLLFLAARSYRQWVGLARARAAARAAAERAARQKNASKPAATPGPPR